VKIEALPASINPEVEVSGCAELAMLIADSSQLELSIGPVTPLIVADALVNVTEAKLANGTTPELDEGTSTIHSADERWAPEALWYVVKESFGRLMSAIVTLNWPALAPLATYCTLAEIESPGETVIVVMATELCGYISYHTEY
jgi:hypothetical protein